MAWGTALPRHTKRLRRVEQRGPQQVTRATQPALQKMEKRAPQGALFFARARDFAGLLQESASRLADGERQHQARVVRRVAVDLVGDGPAHRQVVGIGRQQGVVLVGERLVV